jgi:hypothetical protein
MNNSSDQNLFRNKRVYEHYVRDLTDKYRKSFKPPHSLNDPHLDHIVSIDFGFSHQIDPNVIAKPENLTWISKGSNLQKGSNLTDEGKNLLKEWYKRSIIDSPIGEEIKNENIFFDVTLIFDQFKINNGRASLIVDSSIALYFDKVFCQRDETLRWAKTKRALGSVYLATHSVMQCAVYPDGRIERLDGNTRAHIFRNNLQFPSYKVPKDWLVVFYQVQNKEQAEILYHSIDSALTAETFAEKLSGYMRTLGYQANLPIKWQKGESVYDIAVVVLDNYKPKDEEETINISNVSGDGEKAAKTAECLDYFISELVTLGQMIGNQKIRKELTAPLIGMLIRYLMKNKDCQKTFAGIKEVVNFLNQGYCPWTRPYARDRYYNLYIMMDELQTSDSMHDQLKQNFNVKGKSVTSRRIIPDEATKTTANVRDREMYCGWIAYCFNKYLKDEPMNEDILLDVVGESFDDENVTWNERNRIQNIARSVIEDEYRKFWKSNV